MTLFPSDWVPKERANLCFILKEGRILLIRKKRGLGAGKINGPGGKIEPGETALASAIRETQEEIGVTPIGVRQCGELQFQFVDGYSLHCTVFTATDFTGDLIETDEATPFWAAQDAIPYQEMWADDEYWLPHLLAGRTFKGAFHFDGEMMLSRHLEIEDAESSQSPRRILIAGCGFIGLATARLFHRGGWAVHGVTHSEESAQSLGAEEFPVSAVDLANENAVRAIGSGFDAVIHCASSGRGGAEAYRRVYLEGVRNLLALNPVRLLFTSSTSVYAQADGSLVSEASPAEPERETGRILLETEALVLNAGGIVARLAGIYGPGRSVLLRKFFNDEAKIEGDGRRWINQIHRDDAANALFRLITGQYTGIYNITDDAPMVQADLYSWLANRFGRPLPPSGEVDPNRKRGVTNKRVSNLKLRETGWQPRFPSFQEAVERDTELV